MSDNDDLPAGSELKPGRHTLISVAVDSTQYYEPGRMVEVRSFIQQIDRLDDARIERLRGGALRPDEVGIKTTLEPRHIEILADATMGDRKRDRAKIHARRPMWVEVVKIGAAILMGVLLTLGGQQVF